MSKGFYIDMNSILDTRAGVIRRLNPEAYAGLVKNNYHLRKGDFFEGVDPDAFRKLYEANEVETLMESTVTNVFQFLYPQVAEAMKELVAAEAQHHQRPTVDVNVWPYELTDDEMAYFRSVVYQKLRGIVGVNIFRKDIKELNPGYCAENYFMMISYDYNHFLNAHSNDLIKNPKPFLIMIAPMVYFNTDPDKDEETIEQLKHGINSLSLLEAAIGERLCLKFVNVDIFSITYPDDRVLKVDLPDTTKHMTIEDLDAVLLRHKQGKRIPEA